MTDRVSRPRMKAPLGLPSQSLKHGDAPLAPMLESSFTEQTVPILWHRIQGRLYQPSERRRWPVFTALAAACAVLAIVGVSLFRSNSPLRLSSGQLPAALIAEATPRRVELSDGSSIQVAQQSRLEVVSNDETTFVTALSRGSATFEVNPKAHRRWIVEVGLTSVEVVGTRFTVTRSDSDVTVSVAKGLVLVRGDAVPGGQTRLGAGQQIRTPTTLQARSDPRALQTKQAETANAALHKPAAVSEARVDELPLVNDDDVDDSLAGTASHPSVGEDPLRPPLVALDGDRAGALQKPSSGGERSSGASPYSSLRAADSEPLANMPPQIEALFDEADRAREAGDIARSLAYFEKVIATAPHFDPRRGLAAMSIARMTMRTNPARAAAVLRATLDGMPAALQENANARLVEAYAKSGQLKNAQSAAQRYLERFPNGRRAEDVRRWATP